MVFMQKVVNLLITAGEWTTLEPAIDVGTSRAVTFHDHCQSWFQIPCQSWPDHSRCMQPVSNHPRYADTNSHS